MSDERCAECGAAMATDAPWCTLCLTPRAAPVVPAVPAVAAVAATNATLYAPPVGADTREPAERTWPCHRCREAVPFELDVCPACGGEFLGGAAETPALSLPIVGDLTGRSKAATYAIATGVGVGLALLVITVVAVIGLIL